MSGGLGNVRKRDWGTLYLRDNATPNGEVTPGAQHMLQKFACVTQKIGVSRFCATNLFSVSATNQSCVSLRAKLVTFWLYSAITTGNCWHHDTLKSWSRDDYLQRRVCGELRLAFWLASCPWPPEQSHTGRACLQKRGVRSQLPPTLHLKSARADRSGGFGISFGSLAMITQLISDFFHDI